MKKIHYLILAVGLFAVLMNCFALPPCQGGNVSKWSNCRSSRTLDNGDKYDGDWKDGNRSGQGTYLYLGDTQWKGSKYVGEFLDGNLSGQGIFLWADGKQYVGEFKKSNYNGLGILYLADGSVSQSGIWSAGTLVTSQYVDPNTFTRIPRTSPGLASSEEERAERQRSQTKLPLCPASGYYDNCFGAYKFDSGGRYIGEWKADQINGQGTFIFADGGRYTGEFLDGKYDGQGIYLYKDGKKYIGDFVENRYNGRGIMYLPDGRISESGIYKDDKLIASQYVDPNSFTRTGRANNAPSAAEAQRLENERKAAQIAEDIKRIEEEKRRIALERQRMETQRRSTLPACQGADVSKWNSCYGRWNADGSFAGDFYIGEFQGGTFNGQGTYHHGSDARWKGDKYVGEFNDGKRHGQGTYLFSDGRYFIGEYQVGAPNGRGIDYLADGSVLQSGIYKDGSFVSSQYVDPNSFTRIGKGNSNPLASDAQRLENERKAAQLAEETRRIEEEKRQIALERQRVESQKVQAQTPPDNRRRLALVIGNDNYSSMPRLNNAVNDAKSMSDALKQANFEVISLSNLDKRRMEEALRNFTGKLGRDDVGLFYFSGHGIQADNRNFLIPVAENVKKTSEVPYEGIDVNRVMDNLKDAKNALNIVVLDACRSSLPDARGGMSRGLTVTDAPQGSIIAYATSPGKTASDGDGGNSPYTKNLIRAMQRKGVKIEDVFKEVRQSVIRETNGEQTPSETSYLVGDFYFRP